MVILYKDWLKQITYIGKGDTRGTMEEAMTDFFYNGISPWIHSFGYTWLNDKTYIAKKFLHFCYMINITGRMDNKYELRFPEPNHRNLPEDRETFDYIIDSKEFIKFLEYWNCRDEIIGTRFDHLILEFCYIWINVASGKPGSMTQKILYANEDHEIDVGVGLPPDGNLNRRKYDLY